MTAKSTFAGPVARLLTAADDLLRGGVPSDEIAKPPASGALPQRIAMIFLFGALYGATMGSFGAVGAGRWMQVLFAAAKVPMLLTVSFAISLPSFLVLNTVLGVRGDWREVLRALISMQAGLTVVLASLAPLTIFWYACALGYNAALLFNGAMFAISTLAAQWILRRAYRLLIARNRRHRTLFQIWIVIYSFVAIQMAWVLRPFIGDPSGPIRFFREEAWGNAYVEIGKILARSFGM
jgi:hypothetical protein